MRKAATPRILRRGRAESAETSPEQLSQHSQGFRHLSALPCTSTRILSASQQKGAPSKVRPGTSSHGMIHLEEAMEGIRSYQLAVDHTLGSEWVAHHLLTHTQPCLNGGLCFEVVGFCRRLVQTSDLV